MAHDKMLDGNTAAVEAIKAARVKVISAYPITPQSTIAEKLADAVADGELDANYVRVESEHSALSVALGAQMTGVRAPIVMPVVNRALASPWSLWCDHQDSMAERDSGWMQLYCENVQDVYDLTMCAYRIAEDRRVQLPCMVCLDGFFLSHSMQKVRVAEQPQADAFIGPYRRHNSYIDPEDPMIVNNLTSSDEFTEMRYQQSRGFAAAAEVMEEVFTEFQERFGREHHVVEPYRLEDAKTVLVTIGSMAGTAKYVADRLREQGQHVGVLKIVSFRPFPYRQVAALLKNAEHAAVLDRSAGLGAQGAPVWLEICAALQSMEIDVCGYIGGLGGRDISMDTIRHIFEDMAQKDTQVCEEPAWIDLKEHPMNIRQVLKHV